MNVLTLSALLCLAWLLLGLLVAQCINLPPEDPEMKFDLLEAKIDALAAAVVAGRMTHQTRRAIVNNLLRHAATVAKMERLLLDSPLLSTTGAELVATSETPGLLIYVRPGHMSAWRATLAESGFAEDGIGDAGFAFHGPYPVHLAYKPVRSAVGTVAEVAA